MKPLIVALLLTTFVVNCRGAAATSTAFDAAEDAIGNNKFAKARELFREAAEKDSDPKQRDRALLALANIEWRVFHDDAAARTTLARVATDSSEYANSLSERARLEAERSADFAAAQKFAHAAVAAATKRDDRRRALVTEALVTIEPLLRARRAKQCGDAAALRTTIASLRTLIERDGPLLTLTGRLFDAALLLDDGPAMLEAWRLYYGVAPGAPMPNLLVAPAATLERILPSWRGSAASTTERRELGLALAGSRLFPQAALVLTDPCAREPLPHDADVDLIVAYAASLRTIHDTAEEYYRQIALGKSDRDAFHARIDDEGRALARQLGQRDYSQKALMSELQKRFGTIVTLGETGGISDIHLGHSVIDEQRPVEQYGHSATLRFIALDGIVSNGYRQWAFDGRAGDGGWAADGTIYQVRPLYADGPVRLWLSVADREIRAEEDQKIKEETERDVARAAAEPIRSFRGLELRMRRQDAERLLAAYPQRDAFIAHARDEKFATSIWAHEGRHAIDQKYEKRMKSEDLEYRAKLSEVAITPAPRAALYSGILSDVSSPTPHGRANRKVVEGVTAWMRAHAVPGVDPAKPLMPQLDKLSDEQLRAAFRSLDPYAKPSS